MAFLIILARGLLKTNVFDNPNADKLAIVLRFAIESPLDFLIVLRFAIESPLDFLIVLRFAIESPLDFLHMLRRENDCFEETNIIPYHLVVSSLTCLGLRKRSLW